MWKRLIYCMLFVGLVSCGSKKSDSEITEGKEATSTSEVVNSILGQWEIENVVENDSSYVRPSEIDPKTTAYIDFKEDKTFGVMTNCNHIGGEYVQDKDSISLTNISSTEMACDNMELEEKLKKVLPIVNSIDCLNDSITRLNTSKGDSYIVLRRKTISVK